MPILGRETSCLAWPVLVDTCSRCYYWSGGFLLSEVALTDGWDAKLFMVAFS